MTFTLTFDLFLTKLNLGLNFSTKRDGTLILHILVCIPCGMTFLFKSFDIVTLTLTFDKLMKKNLTLAITLGTKEIFGLPAKHRCT